MSGVLVEHVEDVVVLTLSDPARRNALGQEMAAEFRQVIAGLAGDPARVLVLTGEPPVFSAGGDLAMIERQRQAALDDEIRAQAEMLAFYQSFLGVRSLPVPLIAAVNGHAIGAGLCLALACDLRVVAESAKFAMNFAQIGLHPGMGATALLPAAVGRCRAAQLLYTGAMTTGAELAPTGWAAQTCPAGEVLPRSLALARSIADGSPGAVRRIHTTLRAGLDAQLGEALAVEAAAQVETLRSADIEEGLRAVRERRSPSFGSAAADVAGTAP